MAIEKPINWDLVELYIKSGSSQSRIAKAFKIDDETLRRRVKKKYGKDYTAFACELRSEGEILIEAQQFKKAMNGYWPALLWLGKVRLGQREPEMTQNLAANQQQIDQSHYIMQLQHEIEMLKNENKQRDG